MIHIACCTNEKLAPIFGVVVTSVGINVTSDDVTIHLLHNSLRSRTVKRLQKIAAKYKVDLDLKQIDTDILKDFYFDKSKHYGNVMMFARLLLSSVLPDLDKIIYLDCDIVVLNDLQSLWNFDVSDVAVAMAPDFTLKDKSTLNRLGITTGYYLNSGVILMNLDYWRKHDVQNRIFSYILEKGDKLIYNDQDALNSVLQNERKELHIKYNFSYYYFHRLIGVLYKEKIHEIIEARDNPIIFHYFGPLKPWSLGAYLPGKELFIKYQKLSGWNYKIIQKNIFRRIVFTLVPSLKSQMWENKAYIDGWENYYKNKKL